jgi:ppGpp synthetase/RelA/SpoT-type nucleotidyltranferase
MTLTNSQIDKIGDKLRKDEIDADCLRKLEVFRGLYASAYKYVEDMLENKVGVPITGRPSKSTVAIVEKLKRETIRLNQIQDIAGCRVLVNGLAEQDNLVESLLILFPEVEVDDKRRISTNGYRAVHVIVWKDGRPVEIQIRTRLQHAWAEISEKVADDHGHEIKYGKGDESAREFLAKLSNATEKLEQIRHRHRVLLSRKRARGKSQQLIREIKAVNAEERACIKSIRVLL